jgi:hypothetical protein
MLPKSMFPTAAEAENGTLAAIIIAETVPLMTFLSVLTSTLITPFCNFYIVLNNVPYMQPGNMCIPGNSPIVLHNI